MRNNSFRIFLQNLKFVFLKPLYVILFLVFSIGLYFFFVSQTNADLIVGNFGRNYFNFLWFLQYLLIILLSLFLMLSIFKFVYFSSFDLKKQGIGGFATFSGILVAGCPACSISIASYIGLAGVLSLFPYHGIELKIISVFLLLFTDYYLLKTLQQCSIKKRRK